MRMITACFARALKGWTSRICVHFLLTFQEVMLISKTRNQLPRNPNLRLGTPLPWVVAPFAACVAKRPPRIVSGYATPAAYAPLARVTASPTRSRALRAH